MTVSVGRVAELWRYPVKSLGGERLNAVSCSTRGFEHDRWWALRGLDGKLASGKSSRRFRHMPGLFSMSSFVDSRGEAWVRLSKDQVLRVQDREAATEVSRVVGEPITIAEESSVPHFDDAPIHLLTTSSLRWLARARSGETIERRRFRPNLLIESEGRDRVEDRWLGRTLEIGTVAIAVEQPTVRCAMITMAQPGLPPAPDLLRGLHDLTGSQMGAYARVLREGSIRVGDEVRLVSCPSGTTVGVAFRGTRARPAVLIGQHGCRESVGQPRLVGYRS